MKKFDGFYYRCSFVVCLWVFLSLIGLMVLSSSVFAQCTQYYPCQYGDFKYMVSGGTVTITGYIGGAGVVVIPVTIDGMPVVGIGERSFFDISYLTSVTIPDSVTSIGKLAFYQCSSLTSVTIGNGVTSIGNSAFYSCTSLTSVTIPDSVTSIEAGAFGYCYGLTSIVVDANNTVYSSQDGVLYNKAKTVLIQYTTGKSGGFTIPDSVTSIEAGAFGYCYGLTSVTIPDSVTSIGYGAFFFCTNLTSVTIPNSVTSIESQAFRNCSSLTRAYFYGNAPSVEQQVFAGCSSNFTICYTAGSTGFTNPWYGYPATVCGEMTTSTTVPSTTTTTTILSTTTTTSVKPTTTTSTTIKPTTTTTTVQSTTTTTANPNTTSTVHPTTTTISVTTTTTPISTTTTTKSTTTTTVNGTTTTTIPGSTTTTTIPDGTTTTTIPTTTTTRPRPCAAEAIYGENSEETKLLRSYRDTVLNKTPEGQELIKTYYKFSPTVTKLLEQRPLLKNRAKAFVDSMLPGIRKKVVGSNKEP